MKFPRWMLAGAGVLGATVALAHDFWVQPSAFRVAPDTLVTLDLRVGGEFPGEAVARKTERIASFVAIGPGGTETAIIGQDGKSPAGYARFKEPGLYRIAYRGNPSTIELEPAKFEAYLREEGLEHIIGERAKLGESAAPGKEAYARYAKSFVLVGDAPGTGWDKPAGLKIEIVPETDPFGLKAGGEFRCRVLLEGKPLAGLWLGARSPTQTAEVAGARTDADGRAAFTLPSHGWWLIHGVHMARAPHEAGADWESSWASLTFEVAP